MDDTKHNLVLNRIDYGGLLEQGSKEQGARESRPILMYDRQRRMITIPSVHASIQSHSGFVQIQIQKKHLDCLL